jgi:hypothetical protein
MDSVSSDVNPTPQNADRAWNLEVSFDNPVNINAIAPIRVTRSDSTREISSEKMAIIDALKGKNVFWLF